MPLAVRELRCRAGAVTPEVQPESQARKIGSIFIDGSWLLNVRRREDVWVAIEDDGKYRTVSVSELIQVIEQRDKQLKDAEDMSNFFEEVYEREKEKNEKAEEKNEKAKQENDEIRWFLQQIIRERDRLRQELEQDRIYIDRLLGIIRRLENNGNGGLIGSVE